MVMNSFSDITQQYNVTLDSCECRGFQRWHRCQHNEVLQRAYQRAKAETFAGLRQQFDCRLNGQERAQYLNYCISLGI